MAHDNKEATMTEVIALFFPAAIALLFFMHLRGHTLRRRELVLYYAVFVLLINLTMYGIIIYILKTDVSFENVKFLQYAAAASLLAVVFPLIANIITTSVSIEVKPNAGKTSHQR